MRYYVFLLLLASLSANAGIVSTIPQITAAMGGYIIATQPRQNFKVSEHTDSVLVPCALSGTFFDESNVNKDETLRKCEKRKKMFEIMNNTKYRFGNAKAYDSDHNVIYIELVEGQTDPAP